MVQLRRERWGDWFRLDGQEKRHWRGSKQRKVFFFHTRSQVKSHLKHRQLVVLLWLWLSHTSQRIEESKITVIMQSLTLHMRRRWGYLEVQCFCNKWKNVKMALEWGIRQEAAEEHNRKSLVGLATLRDTDINIAWGHRRRGGPGQRKHICS